MIFAVGRGAVGDELTGAVVVALSDVFGARSPRNEARIFLVLRFTNCSILLFTGVAVVERSAAETRTGIFISIGRSHCARSPRASVIWIPHVVSAVLHWNASRRESPVVETSIGEFPV